MPTLGSIILDTSVAVAHLRGIATVTEKLAEAENLYLPLIALGELYYGILRSNGSEKNMLGLSSWLRVITLLSITELTSKHYSHIKHNLAQNGTPIPENDIWIAAIACEYGFPLAARDRHFELVRELIVLDWR